MEIRRLEDADDVRDIARVETRAWRAAYDGIVADDVLAGLNPERSDEEGAGRLEALREAADAFLVADADGAVVGYADLRLGESTKAFVGDDEAGLKAIYVDPDRWGASVGTALLERGLEAHPDR